MEEKTRQELVEQLEAIRAENTAFMAKMCMMPIPLFGPGVLMPIPMDTTLQPYLNALERHAASYHRLLGIVEKLLTDA